MKPHLNNHKGDLNLQQIKNIPNKNGMFFISVRMTLLLCQILFKFSLIELDLDT